MSGSPRPAAVTLGSRASALASAQADVVASRLQAVRPGLEVVIRRIETTGDRTQASGQPLPEIGGKGLFTQELERALRSGEIDLAVHSLKDLPTDDAPEVVLGAVCARDDPSDCLVSGDGSTLSELAAGAVVGTSSLRRAAQLRAARPDLEVRSIRGNVDTRIRKVRAREYHATVLAAAGVHRLGLDEEVSEWLPMEVMLPAPGQGALAVQCRARDEAVCTLVAQLDDAAARAETTAERAFLSAVGGGCAAPVGARAVARATGVRMECLVASLDGREIVRVHGEGDSDGLGERLGREALAAGADRILAAIHD